MYYMHAAFEKTNIPAPYCTMKFCHSFKSMSRKKRYLIPLLVFFTFNHPDVYWMAEYDPVTDLDNSIRHY